MAALRMKRKSNKGRVRLCSARARYKFIKTSQSLASQGKTEMNTSIQFQQDGCLSSVVPSGYLLSTVPSDTEQSGSNVVVTGFNETSTKLWNLLSSDLLPVGRQGSPSATIPHELETIFSTKFEHGDSLLKPTNIFDEVNHGSANLPNLVADEGEDENRGFTDYQACTLLKFPSESVSWLPFDEKCMMPPFLERTMETSDVLDSDSNQGTMTNSNDACFYLATHQEVDVNCPSDDLQVSEWFNQQLLSRTSPDFPQAVSSSCPNLSPKETQQRKPITLVLDLDETLVHSTLEPCDGADFTFPIILDVQTHTVYVRRRPFLQMFLERVAQMFEIVIFTASQSVYAAQLLDMLDPDHKIISKRMYRESCIFSEGSCTKDLGILGIDLAKVAIIDNSPQVFHLHVNNGIPIESWFDDPSDHALVQILPFLETLVGAEDVRPIIAQKFGIREEQQQQQQQLFC
ncbi:uncharacterized protein C2F7.02c-like isoform X2 [Musa acuminata AAA Group]|uniref:uncharacterized protein C2F7.02c-like isoform X2 n=1 Tax=Musa acuminata AAA Group TaxID=214697 RepID=UPI0031DFB2A9